METSASLCVGQKVCMQASQSRKHQSWLFGQNLEREEGDIGEGVQEGQKAGKGGPETEMKLFDTDRWHLLQQQQFHQAGIGS